MSKFVKYNGLKETFYGCSEADNLRKGKIYEVIAEIDRGFQTDYILAGLPGEEYNSMWFNDVEYPTFMSISDEKPEEGKSLICYRIDFEAGFPTIRKCKTSEVKKVRFLGSGVYLVKTRNSVYYIKCSK